MFETLIWGGDRARFLELITVTRYIRNGVNKANPDKMSRSSQRNLVLNKLINYNAIDSINLVI